MAIDDPRAVSRLVSRLFPQWRGPTIERATEGVSTRVYRLRHGGDTYYLRVLPEAGASLAPEALVHRLLRERGARVPDVLCVEDCSPELQSSTMVTTEVPGGPAQDCRGEELDGVLRAAGRDLAIANSLPVQGFGWIRRSGSELSRLEGELPVWRDLVQEHTAGLALVAAEKLLAPHEVELVEETVRVFGARFDVAHARLAHGDLDLTHIYHENGRYTGIIDWGEIRGADPFYDLAHLRIENGDALPALLAGYDTLSPLPADGQQRLQFSSLYVAVGRLARRLGKGRRGPVDALDLAAIREALAALQ